MTKFIDPSNVSDELSWSKLTKANIVLIYSKQNPSDTPLPHYSILEKDQVISFDETKADKTSYFQITVNVPESWCELMKGKFIEGIKGCANNISYTDDIHTKPITFETNWTNFLKQKINSHEVYTYDIPISSLGHKFRLTWRVIANSPNDDPKQSTPKRTNNSPPRYAPKGWKLAYSLTSNTQRKSQFHKKLANLWDGTAIETADPAPIFNLKNISKTHDGRDVKLMIKVYWHNDVIQPRVTYYQGLPLDFVFNGKLFKKTTDEIYDVKAKYKESDPWTVNTTELRREGFGWHIAGTGNTTGVLPAYLNSTPYPAAANGKNKHNNLDDGKVGDAPEDFGFVFIPPELTFRSINYGHASGDYANWQRIEVYAYVEENTLIINHN
jgi:hypothetical protein